MPRPPAAYQAIHGAADSIEPRLARAFQRSADRMRSRISLAKLEDALASGRVDRVMALVDGAGLDDALAPVAEILRDSFLRGGRLGADKLNVATRRR
jgi:hypothetical protein